jgi:light-regulated signal transduction histidine kinase (bacteriophytochrome)
MLQTFICVATLTALVLAAACMERKSAEDNFRALSSELERRVQQRTSQLEGINKELEALCYSVSHDLRAPLRTIRGFSEVLLEQYMPQLDARGQDYLRRTCDAGLQMDKLIEDLLKLSRVTRGEIQHRDINLSAIARQIADELVKTEPARNIEFAIAPNLAANGDERLLRLVVDNLLRNAWKFTGRKNGARIEFGRENGAASPFFVRDNGVGFDMAYAGKLFGVFQRLHSSSDFSGSGVGLAIVQRVVNRHGGRVWADATVNSGATFYFTLPTANGAPT